MASEEIVLSWSVSDEEEQDEQESDVAVLEVDPGSPENKKLLEKIQDLESSLQEEKLFRKHLEEENELLKNLLQKSSYFLKEMKQRYDDLKGQVERQNEEHGLTVSDPESFTSLLSSFWGDRTVTATPDDSSLKKKEQEKEQEQEQEGTSEWSELSDYAGKVIGSASSSFAPALEMARQAFLTEQITLSDEVIMVLQSLRTMAHRNFEKGDRSHEAMLSSLWKAVRPQENLEGLESSQWCTLGFQSPDPTKDFRGMGLLGLHCLLYVASCYPDRTQQIIAKHEQRGDSSQGTFPWACAGINVCAMLYDLFQLPQKELSAIRLDSNIKAFIHILQQNTKAFEELFSLSFFILSERWDQIDAQYMDFPAVLDYTKNKIGLVLSGFPTSLEECYKEAGVER
eukprot:CAMPEP_0201482642 /NCGR_PEP_ID=MMETSP0151_2-20130828/6908_1 /ASSEMBLY_ACC=CAM_ASM_000257 /TAXON_ID=200890 /ORGANISM="Paramoeba atlantica, Strain 621/1 / CCAP 1560/9" /LENGTH=397 /DNA_ID=CAMNT_0047865423 /DNA_START=44 /DNA_END=1237 /DNA_ORIENTATION=+